MEDIDWMVKSESEDQMLLIVCLCVQIRYFLEVFVFESPRKTLRASPRENVTLLHLRSPLNSV